MTKSTAADSTQVLHAKLASISRGAKAFVVIQIVFVILGILLGVSGGLRLLSASGWDELGRAAEAASSAAGYLFMAWLAGRAADAFGAIVTLIREMSEIV